MPAKWKASETLKKAMAEKADAIKAKAKAPAAPCEDCGEKAEKPKRK
jgi:hypothetical protein